VPEIATLATPEKNPKPPLFACRIAAESANILKHYRDHPWWHHEHDYKEEYALA
jgi:hypothetical protein